MMPPVEIGCAIDIILSEVKKLQSGLIIMPDGIKIFNGNNEPCDMMVGACCCGATHNIEWFLNKLWQI